VFIDFLGYVYLHW